MVPGGIRGLAVLSRGDDGIQRTAQTANGATVDTGQQHAVRRRRQRARAAAAGDGDHGLAPAPVGRGRAQHHVLAGRPGRRVQARDVQARAVVPGQRQGNGGRAWDRRFRKRVAVAGGAVAAARNLAPVAPPDAAVRRHPTARAGVQHDFRRIVGLRHLGGDGRHLLETLGPIAPAFRHVEGNLGSGLERHPGTQPHGWLPAFFVAAQHAQRSVRDVCDQHLTGRQLGDRHAADRRRDGARLLVVPAPAAQIAVVRGQVQPHAGTAQARAQLRNVDRVDRPGRRTHRGRHAGGEAGLGAGAHHPERAGRQVVPAEAAARHQQVGGTARAHGAQRYLVWRALHRDAGAGALHHGGPVVVGVVGAHRHAVGKVAAGQDVVGAQLVERLHAAALADADVRRHPRQAVVGVARATVAVRLQVMDDAHHLPPSGLLGRRQRRPVGGVVADHLHLHGHVVAVRDDGDHRHLLVVGVRRAARRQLRLHRLARVDQREVQAHRQLQPAGRLVDRRRVAGHQHRSALAERPAAARHQVGVAGGVHGDRRLDAGQAALVGQHHGRHAVAVPVHAQHLRVQQQLHARLGEHLLQHELEALAVERPPVPVGPVGGDAPERVQPAHHLAPAVVHDAALPAEGVDAAGGPLTADEAVLLDQQHARPVIRRPESGVHPRHAAAGDQHVDRPLRAQRQGYASLPGHGRPLSGCPGSAARRRCGSPPGACRRA